MSKSIFSAPQFNDEAAAYAYVEARVWPNGRICPHCGVVERSAPLKGKSNRVGLYKCYACRKPFTVKIGTIFEDSHIAMRDWLSAIHLICSSKKGISSNQLHRTLGITLKSAWFLSHRIREAMRDDNAGPLGGQNKVVEMDTTFVGGKEGNKHANKRHRQGRGPINKEAAFSLIGRDGRVRSFHLPEVSAKTLKPILKAQIDGRSYLMTDDDSVYKKLGKDFSGHGSVNHSKGEYVRTGGFHHTNTIENYFSILKRGITGTYFHVSQQHLKRYLAEFDFRYSNRIALGIGDEDRSDRALVGGKGKRLTYRTTNREVTK
jgi:transposase-like protein